MASSSSFSGAIVLGDGQYNVYFVNTTSPASVLTTQMSYGNLTAPAAYQSGIAFCGEGATAGQTVLHAYNVATGNDIWASKPLFFSGSFDAMPAISQDSVLYIAGSDGILHAVDISNATSPVVLWDLNVLQLTPGTYQKVVANLLSHNEKQIFLVTAVGIYGIKLTSRTTPGSVIWTAGVATSFASFYPFLNNTVIVAVSGSTVYAYDTFANPVNSVLPSLWTYVAAHPLYGPENLDCVHMMTADQAGTLYVMDIEKGTHVQTFASGLSSSALQNSFVYNGTTLLSVTGSNQLSVYKIDVTGHYGILLSLAFPAVTISGVTLSGAPWVCENAIYVATTSGSLYALNLGNGAAIWNQSLGSGVTGPLGPMALTPLVAASTASVSFILDGSNYFLVLKNLLIAAKNGSLIDGSNPPYPPTLGNLITSIGAAGNQVYVLMWDTSTVNYVMDNGFEGGLGVWAGMASSIDHLSNLKTQCAVSGPKVAVYLEPYPQFALKSFNLGRLAYGNVGALSQHEKIAIFCIGGVKLALVAGFNLAPPYWDLPAHPMDGVNHEANTYSAWHDTAVLLQGPAASLVEQEFDRRWEKSGQSSSNPPTPTYVKLSAWEVHHSLCLDVPGVCSGSVSPTPFTNPSLTTPAVPVSLLITNADDPNEPIRQIRDQIVAQINLAQQYIYFENFTVHDLGLLQALVEKLTAPGNTCKVIIMLPPPTEGNPGVGEPMIYCAYAILLLMSGAWTQLLYTEQVMQIYTLDNIVIGPAMAPGTTPVTVTITPSQISGLTPLYGSSVYDTSLVYTLNSDGSKHFIPVNAIQGITATPLTASSNLIVSGPVRYFSSPPADNTQSQVVGYSVNFRGMYIHSKLALFDDAVAIIGSGNFNGRSMMWDGEMSALINDPATVAGIRMSLFLHWNMTTAASWASDILSFVANPSERVGVVSLALGTFASKWPRKKMRLVFDLLGVDPGVVL